MPDNLASLSEQWLTFVGANVLLIMLKSVSHIKRAYLLKKDIRPNNSFETVYGFSRIKLKQVVVDLAVVN